MRNGGCLFLLPAFRSLGFFDFASGSARNDRLSCGLASRGIRLYECLQTSNTRL